MILATSRAETSALSRHALRRDEGDAVGRCEIAERVVGGDDLAPVRRYVGNGVIHLGVEGIEPGGVRGRARVVGALAGGIGS